MQVPVDTTSNATANDIASKNASFTQAPTHAGVGPADVTAALSYTVGIYQIKAQEDAALLCLPLLDSFGWNW